jgi:sarcosine oxidase subunit beta
MTLPESADVVIVGGGVMGASAAYHLARQGGPHSRIVLLEREPFFGQGATGRCAGGIRHQFGTAINIKLSLHSLKMLDEFEAETGQPALVRKCGYLFALTRERDLAEFRRDLQLQHALGVKTEWLSADDVRRRAAPCEFPDALAGTFYSQDGLADPYSVVMGYVTAARRLGALCLTDVAVTGIEVAGGKVSNVETNQGRIATRAVVNCAGPWSAAVGRMAGVEAPVAPLRRQWLTTTPLPDIPPDFPFVIDFAQSLYFHREGEGLLTGMTNTNETAGDDQTVDLDWELIHMEAAMKRLPQLERAGVVSRCAGLYENTPDAHPIIGATPVEGYYLLTGFSGHGFMHGPIGGKLIAEVILTGRAHTLDIGPLAYARFAEKQLAREYHVV